MWVGKNSSRRWAEAFIWLAFFAYFFWQCKKASRVRDNVPIINITRNTKILRKNTKICREAINPEIPLQIN
ncbi:hypothetical protein DMA11_22600 [Marinilabiliaceae bacterium JC017]|nr:hypothetical protein DMA11_22600 [Marinilabiliaceae bacterium JC017]